MKKLSELAKVKLLEEVVQKGTLEDLTDMLEAYGPFEMTARALSLAARYRGIEYVKLLAKYGATFHYNKNIALQRKYKSFQLTGDSYYMTEYYLMIIPEKLDLNEDYAYSRMCGIPEIKIMSGMNPLCMEKRMESVQFFMEKKELGVSMDEMLFWALIKGEIAFADALMEMGAALQKIPPAYHRNSHHRTTTPAPVYITIITEGNPPFFWNDYVKGMASLKAEQVLAVFERFHALAQKAGKTLILSQKMMDEIHWNQDSLKFAFRNMDLSRINQKKALEDAAANQKIWALEVMAQAGWLKNSERREKLIAFTLSSGYCESLAWLMDFKEKNVDLAAEEAKEEAKMFRELMEKPDSVSAMKKIWSYQKQEDGTLVITSYKGQDTEVEIPAFIGKRAVTAIGKEAFCTSSWKKMINFETRKKIISVVIPEGILSVGDQAFQGCEFLQKISLPKSLKTIGKGAFWECRNLKNIIFPNGNTAISRDSLSM